jgi:hypothetical protein
MWVVELNVLGHRCSLEVSARRSVPKLSPRSVGTRLAQLRHPRAA